MSIGPSAVSASAHDTFDLIASGEVAEHADGAHAVAPPTSCATAVSVVPSPYSAGPFSRMPCMATVGAEAREPLGEGPAEPAACAGHQRHFSGEWLCVMQAMILFSCVEVQSAARSMPMASACTRHIGATRVRSAGSGMS